MRNDFEIIPLKKNTKKTSKFQQTSHSRFSSLTPACCHMTCVSPTRSHACWRLQLKVQAQAQAKNDMNIRLSPGYCHATWNPCSRDEKMGWSRLISYRLDFSVGLTSSNFWWVFLKIYLLLCENISELKDDFKRKKWAKKNELRKL